jgi:hypothetical protein
MTAESAYGFERAGLTPVPIQYSTVQYSPVQLSILHHSVTVTTQREKNAMQARGTHQTPSQNVPLLYNPKYLYSSLFL